MNEKAKERILKITKRILELAGFEANLSLNQKTDQILVEIEAQPLGLLIGRQGQNLKALERILQVVFYQTFGQNKIVTVDAAGFRKKRTQALEERVSRAIEEILRTGQPQVLEGLTASERKAVHLKVAEFNELTSESQGAGVNRVLIVKPRK